ncbi:MAG TPA: hypothetical protein VFY40_01115 [Blastocatellia bacterium]|nr:hypothetical protein [Blastocatellia bacterium]
MSIRTEEEMNETTQSDEMTASSQIETLDDLQVEEDEHVKGGPFGGSGLQLNHNETAAEDDEAEEEAKLDDLPVSNEREDKVKGGPGGFGAGGLYLNHNETAAEDNETDAEALADLPVTQANKIRDGITDPAETTPSLRPPPPKLPPDAPKPISS